MKKRFLSILSALCVVMALLPLHVSAAVPAGLRLQSALDWDGAGYFGGYDYSVSKPKTGYAAGYHIIDNGDGTVSGLVVGATEFYVERYDALGNVVMSKTLPLELPIFGAFLAGEDCYYMAFGQENDAEDDSLEVWRIVKYDRDWNRMASVSANGGETYTTIPFRSTVARMALSEDGETLALYASRQRYTSDDGLRHQSNITFLADAGTMTWKEIMGGEFPVNHVSHSFGQFVRFDGDDIVTVDHGDAYPRSFVLQAEGMAIDLLDIYGKSGDNVTNAIGSGFEVSDDGYLFLGCSDPQTGADAPWNLFLAFVEEVDEDDIPGSMTVGGVTVHTGRPSAFSGTLWTITINGTSYYVTGASGSDEASAAVLEYQESIAPAPTLIWLTRSDTDVNCARLVKLDDDSFAAMWSQPDGLHWQLLDGTGQRQGGEHILAGVPMPPTDPIVCGRSIRWIQVVDNDAGEAIPYLFTLDVDTASLTAPPVSEAPAAPVAYARTETVDIGGQKVELYAYGLRDGNGNYTNYVKLRDIAYALNGTAAQFEVGWDGAVNILTGQGYTANGTEMTVTFDGDHGYTPSDAAVKLNGSAVELEGICLTDESGSGYNYYKLRDLGRLLGFNVDWTAERGIFIEPDKPYTEAN